MQVEPIGVIHSPFRTPRDAPPQPRAAEGVRGTVEVFEPFVAGLKDLEGFERVWLLYWFDRAVEARMTVEPFLDGEPRGLFATRAPCRPNPIGLSSVRLVAIEGNVLHVEEIDVLDGTPLLDLKPYAPAFDSFEGARCGWLGEALQRRRLADAVTDERFYNEG